MNREIKFRAWTGERMFEPYYFERAFDGYEMPYKCYEDWRDLEDGRSQFCEIMQYISQKDKTGKEIYDRDIISWGGNDKPAVIQWSDKYSSFGLKCEGWWFLHFFGEAVDPSDCEVIGNIYQNPDLIKTQ